MSAGPADRPEVAVVGAGPAGLAAAKAAAMAGARVVLIDEADRAGGQIWRARRGGHMPAPAHARLSDAERLGVEFVPSTLVWAVVDERTLLVQSDGEQVRAITPKSIVVATGAHDRSFAFPGWTLPGVLTAGGLQAMAKSQLVVPGRRIALAGSGPFLLPVACALLDAGVELVAVVEATRRRAWLRHATRLRHAPGRLVELAAYEGRLARARVDRLFGAVISRAVGTDRVGGVEFTPVDADWHPRPGGRARLYEVDAVGLGYGFQPNLELARLLGCRLTYSVRERQHVVWRNPAMGTSVTGIFAPGEVGGTGGWMLADAQGWVAGAGAAAHCGHVPSGRRLRRARRRVARLGRFADLLADLFGFRPGALALLNPDTPICRCEGITVAEIERAFVEPPVPSSPSALKTVTRVAMGPCQGRICGPLLAQVGSERTGAPVPGFGLPSGRPPIKPVSLGSVADLTRTGTRQRSAW